MKKIKSLGLIGVGNMGTAILEGLFRRRLAAPSGVLVYDKIGVKAAEFAQKWKARRAKTNAEVVEKSDAVLLAIKPQDLEELKSNPALSETFRRKRPAGNVPKVVISILAGTPVAKVRAAVGGSAEIVRAMPNLGAKVGEAVTAITGGSEKSLALAEQIFSGCGKTVRLEEKHFDLVTAVSGSGPAYFFLLMELLMKEGIAGGLSEKSARLLAVQTAVGAGLLARAAAESPEELRKMVTSKGGTTEAALGVLESKNFPATFHEAVSAAIKRGKELN